MGCLWDFNAAIIAWGGDRLVGGGYGAIGPFFFSSISEQSISQSCQSSFQGLKLIFEEPKLGIIVAIAALNQSVAFSGIEDMTMACIIGHEHQEVGWRLHGIDPDF
jgi:hypothetical protein